MYYIYVIKNQYNKIYIGYTFDLEKRLKRHNGELPNKKTSFTSKNKGCWKYIYIEKTENKKIAIIREKYLKSYRGRLSIKKIINGLVDPPANRRADF